MQQETKDSFFRKKTQCADFATSPSQRKGHRSWASDMTGEPGENSARKPGRRRFFVDLSGSVLWNYDELCAFTLDLHTLISLIILDLYCISMELLFINVGRSAIPKKK